jgi:hypothetical protein
MDETILLATEPEITPVKLFRDTLGGKEPETTE